MKSVVLKRAPSFRMASNLHEHHRRLRRQLKRLKIEKSSLKETGDELGRGSYGVVVVLEVKRSAMRGKEITRRAFQLVIERREGLSR